MASQVDNEPQSGTDDFVHDDHGPECSQQTGQGRETYRIPIDIRDSSFQVHARTEDLNSVVSNASKMSIDAMMELQLKQMQFMKELTEHLSYDSVIDKDRHANTDTHGGTHIAATSGTKRSRNYDDGEDNTDNTPSKQVKGVDDEIESVDEFDTLVCGVEKAGGGNGTQSADVITDDVDMKEVNLLMDEMVEFYNDSEETGAAIEESLAKSINSSLRSKIPESKFNEMKAKYKRPENCGNLMIPKVNEQVWTEKHPMMNSIRSHDLKLQKIMGYTIKGMIPVIETANDILKAALKKESFEPTKNLRKVTDGIRMLAASYTQLNQYRKDKFKPILTGKFKKLAFANNSVTDKLFGDDLQKKIEDIQKSKNITVTGFSDKTTGNGPYNNKITGNFNYNNRQLSETFGGNSKGNFKGRFLDKRYPSPNKRGRGGRQFNKSH